MPLRLAHTAGSSVTILADDAVLLRYVYVPTTPANESPRPYIHPVNTLAGDTLTNFRPNDHPWHHALSFTLNSVSGANFWGGPTCLPHEGYKPLDNHGAQQHLAWTTLDIDDAGTTATLAHTLEWRRLAEVFFREERTLVIALAAGAADSAATTWSLRWRSRLVNASGRTLTLGNPHSHGGLPGSHYNGLQFRGARELLDDHLDPTIKIVAEGGLEGVAAVHGAAARWMEWHGQLDESLHRVVIRFENNLGPLPWFVRRNYPLAALPVQFDRDLEVAPGAEILVDHTLSFRSLP